MRNRYLFSLFCLLLAAFSFDNAIAQVGFTNSNSLLSNPTFKSGNCIAVTDVNHDGLDDIVKLELGHIVHLELQQRDGSLQHHMITDLGAGKAWAMNVADVDKNGWKDVVADNGNDIYVVMLDAPGGTITSNTVALPTANFFLQNMTFADFNSDGWIDLFCCDDNDAAKLYMNDGAGNLLASNFVDFAVNPGMFYGSDPYDSGNYGSCWTDFDNDNDLDLYVAHCRQSTTSPTDQRRINRLFVNDGNNNFTEAADTYGIAVGWQTWTSSFGDLDNDGDLDLLLTNHDHDSQIFENDGTGHFTEITGTNVTTTSITPIESVLEDFDNDGYLDILITGSEWMFYRNNGNMTFTRVFNLLANNGMLSFATGDLNHDGFIDLYTSYGNIYNNPSNTYNDVLYLNNGNTNHFITFDLTGTVSDLDAIGARVTIYGPFGIQIREVRAGESYGTCNSSHLHFGLGATTSVDSAVVRFPSGITHVLYNLVADQFVKVVENGCEITGNILPGPHILCSGQSLTLNAAAGFTAYNWSNGGTTNSITVSNAGVYNVMVTDANGCTNISPNALILVDPDETPTVTPNGNLTDCEGGSLALSASAATAYTWNNGATTQTIQPVQTGWYKVTTQGTCAQFTSDSLFVTILDAPEPVGTGAAGPPGSQLMLSATGTNVNWYDAVSGGNNLASGNTYTTPPLFTTTTYYVDDLTPYPGPVNYTGMIYHQGTDYTGSNNTNASMYFNVLAPCKLVSVKVYTDTPGQREIVLTDDNSNVLAIVPANIPMDTSRVTLNLNLTPGISYRLTTNPLVNLSSFGFSGPRLKRSSAGISYPYTISNVLAVTTSSQGNSFYYYFFDWEVEEPSYQCLSDRVPVVADISTGLQEPASGTLAVYPNPVNGILHIRNLTSATFSRVDIYDVTGRLVMAVSEELDAGTDMEITTASLDQGMYLLKAYNGENAGFSSFVIRR